MRGKVIRKSELRNRFGITPACAGKSRQNTAPARFRWDHPRVCGEKYGFISVIAFAQGSPPRVRGKGGKHLEDVVSVRITPACAGKRLRQAADRRCSRDHPRVCGEKSNLSLAARFHPGSPPRVRGKAAALGVGNGFSGITPACAGKRVKVRLLRPATRDHPRVCGEKSIIHF